MSPVCVALTSSDILLEFQWYKPESKGGASELRLLMPRLIFPSLGTSPLLLSVLGCNSKLDLYPVFVPNEDNAGREV